MSLQLTKRHTIRAEARKKFMTPGERLLSKSKITPEDILAEEKALVSSLVEKAIADGDTRSEAEIQDELILSGFPEKPDLEIHAEEFISSRKNIDAELVLSCFQRFLTMFEGLTDQAKADFVQHYKTGSFLDLYPYFSQFIVVTQAEAATEKGEPFVFDSKGVQTNTIGLIKAVGVLFDFERIETFGDEFKQGIAAQKKALNKMNRRSFLGAIGAIIGYAPQIGTALANVDHHLPDKVVEVEKGDAEPFTAENYPNTNQKHLNGDFHNLGVIHTREDLLLEGGVIQEAIANCDIVCREKGWYFRDLAKTAEEQGKEVILVDDSSSELSLVQLLTTFEASRQIAKGVLSKENGNAWLKSLGMMQYGSRIPPSIILGADHPLDISYLTKGRSIFMYEKVLQVIKDNPGKKVLFISGDAHAADVEGFIAHPRLFKLEQAFYNTVFYPHKELAKV